MRLHRYTTSIIKINNLLILIQAELTRVRRLLVAAAERGEAGTALLERSKTEGNTESTTLDPQQLEKELLLAREAVNCE